MRQISSTPLEQNEANRLCKQWPVGLNGLRTCVDWRHWRHSADWPQCHQYGVSQSIASEHRAAPRVFAAQRKRSGSRVRRRCTIPKSLPMKQVRCTSVQCILSTLLCARIHFANVLRYIRAICAKCLLVCVWGCAVTC